MYLLADLVISMATEAVSNTEEEGQQKGKKDRTRQILKDFDYWKSNFMT